MAPPTNHSGCGDDSRNVAGACGVAVSRGLRGCEEGEAAARLRGLLARLNERQRSAVLAPADAPLLVAAGPGSGKTSAMIARVAFLMAQARYSLAPPSRPIDGVFYLPFGATASLGLDM